MGGGNGRNFLKRPSEKCVSNHGKVIWGIWIRVQDWGGCGEGGTCVREYSLPTREFFYLGGFKGSDLVHTLGEFVRKLSVQK